MSIATSQPIDTRPDRLKVAFKYGAGGAADPLEATKKTIERIRGRELAWDEFMTTLLAHYVDLPAENAAVDEIRADLQGVVDKLRRNREERAADIVSIFSDALVGVLRGETGPGALYNAILDVE